MKIANLNFQKDLKTILTSVLFITNLLGYIVYLLFAKKYLDILSKNNWTKSVTLFSFCFATIITPFLVSINNHTIAAFIVLIMLSPFIRENLDISKKEHIMLGLCGGFLITLEFPSLFFVFLISIELFRRDSAKFKFFIISFILPVLLLFIINKLTYNSYLPAYAFFGTQWYDFDGSYWQKVHNGIPKPEIDYLRDPKYIYLFNLLFGHHGFFSLTPIFLILFINKFTPNNLNEKINLVKNINFIKLTTILSFIVVVLFYTFISNNYGGKSCGARWLIWFYPLVLISIVDIIDRLSHLLKFRLIVYVLIAVSLFSAWEVAKNPWQQPWLYEIFEQNNLLNFVGYQNKPRGILT